jgi:hypothetical protein
MMSIEAVRQILAAMNSPFQETVLKAAKATSLKVVELEKVQRVLGGEQPSQEEVTIGPADRGGTSDPMEIEETKSDPVGMEETTRIIDRRRRLHPGRKGDNSGPARPPVKDVIIGAREVIIVSPTFKLVFLSVVSLTVLSGFGATAMAFAADGAHVNQQAVFDTMNTTWKLGLGAIFGLLGGKAA